MSGPINIPNTASVVTVTTSNAEKTLLLPLTASIYGKIITIKDISSNAANCNITDFFRSLNKRDMTVVQGTHGWHKAYRMV